MVDRLTDGRILNLIGDYLISDLLQSLYNTYKAHMFKAEFKSHVRCRPMPGVMGGTEPNGGYKCTLYDHLNHLLQQPVKH